MGPGTRFAYQHDARRQSDGTITIFDNGNMNEVEQSRGIVLELDEKTMTAELVREYTHPDKVRPATQGNVQVLPSSTSSSAVAAIRSSPSSARMASCSSAPPSRPRASPTGPFASRGAGSRTTPPP